MNDTELKQLLAKMLPDKTEWISDRRGLWHKDSRGCYISNVLDTELLHLASLVEAGLTREQQCEYMALLEKRMMSVTIQITWPDCHATWQQRVTALASVKGVTL